IKAFFRKPHPVDRIQLCPGVLMPFKTEGRTRFMACYKARYEIVNRIVVTTLLTKQICLFYFSPLHFVDLPKTQAAPTNWTKEVLQVLYSHNRLNKVALKEAMLFSSVAVTHEFCPFTPIVSADPL